MTATCILENVALDLTWKSGWLSLLGVWCPSRLWLFWHWLDLVLLVSLGGKWSQKKEKKPGLIAVGLAVMSVQTWLWPYITDSSCNCPSFHPCWLQGNEFLMGWLFSVNGLVAAILPPAPPPLACVLVGDFLLLYLQQIKGVAIKLSLRQSSPGEALAGPVHLCIWFQPFPTSSDSPHKLNDFWKSETRIKGSGAAL